MGRWRLAHDGRAFGAGNAAGALRAAGCRGELVGSGGVGPRTRSPRSTGGRAQSAGPGRHAGAGDASPKGLVVLDPADPTPTTTRTSCTARLREADHAWCSTSCSSLAPAPRRNRRRGRRPAASGRRGRARPRSGVRFVSNLARQRREEQVVGVFDSGLGGLTVLRSLIDLLPGRPLVYFGDTGRFPYGPKPADEVLKYTLRSRTCSWSRREAPCGRLQRTPRPPARAPAVGPRHPGHRRDRTRAPGHAPGHPQRSHRRHRHGRHHLSGATNGSRAGAGEPIELTCAACPASSSSSRRATSTPTRCTCWPSGCSPRCEPRASTPWCSAARTIRCWPVRSAT